MTSQKMCDCNQGRRTCTCKPEAEHGVQASPLKLRIDEQAKPVPPAVGEFAVLERDQLKADNAELRARLAKYEDAEGRPLVALPEPYGWVSAGGFYTDRESAIAAAGKTPCIDVYSRPQMDASENRSLQRQAVAEYLAKELDSACAEIRALKAQQPSGVACANDWFLSLPPERQAVLREDKWLLADAAFKAGQSLNSSPVSSGDDDDQAYDAEAERMTTEALGVGAGINPNATSIDDIFLTESAGGVDERAAFELQAAMRGLDISMFTPPSEKEYRNPDTQSEWLGWQARAALTASAPNHSEQVREVVPGLSTALFNALEAYKKTRVHFHKLVDQRKHDEQCELIRQHAAQLLAVAPSAGSQKEQE